MATLDEILNRNPQAEGAGGSSKGQTQQAQPTTAEKPKGVLATAMGIANDVIAQQQAQQAPPEGTSKGQTQAATAVEAPTASQATPTGKPKGVVAVATDIANKVIAQQQAQQQQQAMPPGGTSKGQTQPTTAVEAQETPAVPSGPGGTSKGQTQPAVQAPVTPTGHTVTEAELLDDGRKLIDGIAPTAEIVETNEHNGEEVGKRALDIKAPNSAGADGAPVEPKSAVNYDEMMKQLEPFKPMSKEEAEELKKKERRDKVFASIGDGISALKNLYHTTQGAPNMFDPRQSMTEKTRERYDRMRKEQQENARFYLPAYMNIEKMKADDARDQRDYAHRLAREKADDDWRNKMHDYQQGRDEANDQFRNEQFEWQKDSWQKQFDKQAEQWTKQFNEQVRSNKAHEGLAWANYKASREGNNLVFTMGDAGNISINKNAINENNIAHVFNATPSEGRPTASFDPVTGKRTPLSMEEMMQWIGMNANNPDVQAAWKEVGGKVSGNKSNKGTGYDGGNGKGKGY